MSQLGLFGSREEEEAPAVPENPPRCLPVAAGVPAETGGLQTLQEPVTVVPEEDASSSSFAGGAAGPSGKASSSGATPGRKRKGAAGPGKVAKKVCVQVAEKTTVTNTKEKNLSDNYKD